MKIFASFSDALFHLNWFENDLNKLYDFLNENKIDGIEWMIYDGDINFCGDFSIHLSYYPNFYDFYRDDNSYLIDYPNKSDLILNFGSVKNDIFVKRYKSEFKRACELKAKYMVFHISNSRYKDAFTFKFSYSDMDIIKAKLEIVNEAFDDSLYDYCPYLLFENLWYKGLNFLDFTQMDYIINNVKYKNIGFVLDLSHLMLTNRKLKDLDSAACYIMDILKGMGSRIDLIKVIHINSIIFSSYIKDDYSDELKEYLSKSGDEKNNLLFSHIKKLDSHAVFDNSRLNEIIEYVNPEYIVFELDLSDKEKWMENIIKQRQIVKL